MDEFRNLATNPTTKATKGPFCQTCARKWGKQLWAGSCVCTGDVRLGGAVVNVVNVQTRHKGA